MSNNTEDRVFLVVSQSRSAPATMLKLITRAEYNHVSIGLTEKLDKMYSFGRLNAYNPFIGGFVEESPNFGTFKRFKNTKVLIFSLDVGTEKYNEISDYIFNILSDRKNYHYNYYSLFLAIFKKVKKRDKYFYCSEFVRDVLRNSNVQGSHEMPEIVKPINFLNLPNIELIYKGKLKDYSKSRNMVTVE